MQHNIIKQNPCKTCKLLLTRLPDRLVLIGLRIPLRKQFSPDQIRLIRFFTDHSTPTLSAYQHLRYISLECLGPRHSPEWTDSVSKVLLDQQIKLRHYLEQCKSPAGMKKENSNVCFQFVFMDFLTRNNFISHKLFHSQYTSLSEK